MRTSKLGAMGTWHHFVLTYDGTTMLTYVDGVSVTGMFWTNADSNPTGFCGSLSGSLVMGQEQDTYGGGFVPEDTATIYVGGLIAVYNTCWSESQVAAAASNSCVNAGKSDLFSLYVGEDGATTIRDRANNNPAAIIHGTGSATSTRGPVGQCP